MIRDELDVEDELVANGEKHPTDSGAFYAWLFHFDDLPELKYTPPYCLEPRFALRVWKAAKLACWGTIRAGSARGLGGGTGEQ